LGSERPRASRFSRAIGNEPKLPKLHRLEENLAAADLELTSDELREIGEAQLEAQGARYSEANQRMIDR
jgi:diketogulonate reductase-like aldo/keto reductase